MCNAIAYDVIFNVTEIATSIFREILSVGAYMIVFGWIAPDMQKLLADLIHKMARA